MLVIYIHMYIYLYSWGRAHHWALVGEEPIIINHYCFALKQTNNIYLLEKDGGTKNCIYKD